MDSLILDVQGYVADAYKRRNVLSTRAVVGSSQVRDQTLIVPISTPSMVLDVLPSNQATLIYTSAPLSATVVVGGVVLAFVLESLFVFTSNVTSITLGNSSTTVEAEVFLLQA